MPNKFHESQKYGIKGRRPRVSIHPPPTHALTAGAATPEDTRLAHEEATRPDTAPPLALKAQRICGRGLIRMKEVLGHYLRRLLEEGVEGRPTRRRRRMSHAHRIFGTELYDASRVPRHPAPDLLGPRNYGQYPRTVAANGL